jgi:hypothetical protein
MSLQQVRRSRKGNKNSNIEAMMFRLLSQSNVKYIAGSPKNVLNTERVYTMWITTTTIYTAASNGAMAQTQTLDPVTRITNWATMWGKLFQQYCVLEVVAVFRPKAYATTSTGQVIVLLSEDSSSPSSLCLNREHGIVDFLNLSAGDDRKSALTVKWTPTSSEDWQWTAITTNNNISYVKVYSDVGNTGMNSTDTTGQLMANLTYKIAFRYYF